MKSTIPFAAAYVVCLLASVLMAQTGKPNEAAEFDHAALYVQDLKKSAEFYEQLLGLERVADPFKDEMHVWLRTGAHQQLHLIAGAQAPAPHKINVHMAFRVASVTNFVAYLDRKGVNYRRAQDEQKIPTIRPDGVKQVYFQDPDGYWIEVNDAKY